MLSPTRQDVWYERASAGLLAQTPAILPRRAWASNDNWEQMRNYLEQSMLGDRNWRTSWWAHWAELAANIYPERYHWLVTPNQMTRGSPINQDVVDSTPAQAVEVAAAGMMDGLTNPSKIWWKPEAGIDGYEPSARSKRWFADLRASVAEVMEGSNWYDALHQMYGEEIVFGSAPVLIYEHRENVINCQNPCAGEFYLKAAPDYSTRAFSRQFTQTVLQLVEWFGPEALAGTPPGNLWDNKGANLATEFVVGHAIEPNFPANQYGQVANLGVVPGGFAYREYYWLFGQPTPRPLSARGFHEKPLMSPLWSVRSNDPYGRSPGMKALPDVRQLHRMQMRLAEGIEKQFRPPMLADVKMKNQPSSTLPGRITFVPDLGKDTGMRPAYTVTPDVKGLTELIKQVQGRVERWFYNDVFMMISQMEGVQPRNELELTERRGEKLLRLGPVVERNLREFTKGINRIVSIMTRRGMIPPKPPDLRGVPIRIKYVSKLALIAAAARTAGMERTLAMAGRMEPLLPGTLDNFSQDRFIRDYGDRLDFPDEDWASEDEMKHKAAVRAQQAQQAQAAQLATHTAPAVADAAQTMSETPVGGGMSALQAMVGQGGGTGGFAPPAQ
jgi:hypothetical protein